jgi:hypothetical protein
LIFTSFFSENKFTRDMVKSFAEEDILEFKGLRDRFLLRRFKSVISTGTSLDTSSTSCGHGNTAQSNQETTDDDHNTSMTDIDDDHNTSMTDIDDDNMSTTDIDDDHNMSTTDIDDHHKTTDHDAAAKFTTEDLLCKQGKGVKGNRAQVFFNTLLKDSANSANIWKKAPKLSEISERKKEIFLESISRVAPQLKWKREQVWHRLGEHLQNRRKYVKDKECGKRVVQSKSPKSSQTSTSLGSTFRQGDNVNLMNKAKTQVIAKGIFLSRKDGMFSELVLTTVLHDPSSDEMELPAPVGTKTTLSKDLIKTIILWKTERLTENKTKKQITLDKQGTTDTQRGTTDKQRGTTDKQRGTTDKQRGTTDTQRGTTDKQRGTTDKQRGTTDKQRGTTDTQQGTTDKQRGTTDTQRGTTDTQQGTTDTQQGTTDTQQGTTDTQQGTTDNLDPLFVFEWGLAKRELYLGLMVNGSSITNCQKPVGKIVDGVLMLPNKLEQAMLKINKNDTQENPDKQFCVFSTDEYEFDMMSNSVVILNEAQFLQMLSEAFKDY